MEVATSNGTEVNEKGALLSVLSPAKGHWNGEEATERRNFLGALTAASLGILLEGSLTEFADAPSTAQGGTSVAGQAPFKTSQVEVSGNTIFVRRYGKGPAILMVHGFPRTSLMWRFLAPKLAENHTVICADLRAYGRSGIPASTDDHFPYSKRAMAAELVDVMDNDIGVGRSNKGFGIQTLLPHRQDVVARSESFLRSILHAHCID
jgi:alpha/beta hydrolase fold